MRHKRSAERAMKEIMRNGIPMKRSTPRRTEQDRDPKYREYLRVFGPKYREYLRVFGKCEVCHSTWGSWPWATCDPCHTENGGMHMKGPDSGCAPLCRTHHDQYDGRAKLPNGEVGKRAFEAHYGIDMRAVAAKWYKQYLETR